MQRVDAAAVLQDSAYAGQGGFHAKTTQDKLPNYHDILLGDFLEREILTLASEHWPEFQTDVENGARAHVSVTSRFVIMARIWRLTWPD
jgi:hypothetical protein